MVYEFETIDELEKAIIEDKDEYSISSNRFPIRFIFLNSHDELKSIVNLLNNHNTKRKELSSLLYSENSWFSDDQIISEIKKIDETTLIVPLSEYIRFSTDESFKKLITALSEIENNKIKIYVPLVGLWGRFKNLFWNDFYRKDNWAPIWKLKTEPKKIKIYQINFNPEHEIKQNKMELVSNTQEWFNLWKKDNITNIISLPRPLSIFFKNSLPDQTFYQEKINNSKEYLSKILEIEIDIEYKENEKKYWDELLFKITNKNKNYVKFIDYFNDEFNIKNAENMNELEYAELYQKKSSSYEKWIIKNSFIESNTYKNTYLYDCFQSLNTLDDKTLTKNIFLKIFDKKPNNSILEERRKLLKTIENTEILLKTEFENKYKNIEKLNYKEQLKYLTNSTEFEKQKIIEIVQENGIKNTIDDIKHIYPELYYYLDWNLDLENVEPWIIDYFKEYNQSKILNEKSSKLTELLNEKNNPEEIHNWLSNAKQNSRNVNINDGFNIWIDGLGAEWLPLLINLLNKYGKKYGKHVTYKTINSVTIPSATKFNKIECDEKKQELDKYIHDNQYKHPKSLIEEIELIKKIAKNIVSSDHSKISLFSDHGFSFLCNSNFGCNKKYDFKNAEHGGRYSICEQKGTDNEDYIYVKLDDDENNKHYRIASKHTSLYNTPTYEVHGGATPEEVLVPQIIIENNYDEIKYDISYQSKVNVSKEPKLPIKIKPTPSKNPIAVHNNKPLHIDLEDEEYIINLDSNMNAGKQTITIKINDEIIDELDIEIEKGGIQSADDDWF